MKATPFEDRIFLYWKEPAEPNGIITQYEVMKLEGTWSDSGSGVECVGKWVCVCACESCGLGRPDSRLLDCERWESNLSWSVVVLPTHALCVSEACFRCNH